MKRFQVSSVHGISGAFALLLILCVAFMAAPLRGFSGASHPALDGNAKRGGALFHQHCIVCHNKLPGDTSPFGPPNLHGIFRASSPIKLTPAQATTIITDGKGNMPAFGKKLTKGEIRCLIAYLKAQ